MRSATLLLVLLLATPLAAAHIDHDRESIQRFQYPRSVNMTTDGLTARADLVLVVEPLRHLVRHTVDPRVLVITSEHRADASVPDSGGIVRWELTRLVEYADTNLDGIFQPAQENVARSWRFVGQSWNASGVRDVAVSNAIAKDHLWEGATRAGPNITVEVTAAGRAFTDEGARVRNQDVIIYLDIHAIPERGVGRLHALEGRVVLPRGGDIATESAQNATVAMHADVAGDRAFLVWGGEALLDGREQPLRFSLDPPTTEEDGNVTRAFRIHFPATEHDARLVLVAGMEFVEPDTRRSFLPWDTMPMLAAALAAAAVAGRRLRPSR